MKRSDRHVEIQQLSFELEKHRQIAQSLSQQPLALIKRHPLATLAISVLVFGTATRIVLTTPVSMAIKILGIPLLRQVASTALALIRQTRQY